MMVLLQRACSAADKPQKPPKPQRLHTWATKTIRRRSFEEQFSPEEAAASHATGTDYTQLQGDGSSSSDSEHGEKPTQLEHGAEPTELESRVVALLRMASHDGNDWGPRIEVQKKAWQEVERDAASQKTFTVNGQRCVREEVDDLPVLVTALRWEELSEIATILEQFSSDSSGSSAPSSE